MKKHPYTKFLFLSETNDNSIFVGHGDTDTLLISISDFIDGKDIEAGVYLDLATAKAFRKQLNAIIKQMECNE